MSLPWRYGFFSLIFLLPLSASGKDYTVCSVTINSDAEINTIMKRLPPNFHKNELTLLKDPTTSQQSTKSDDPTAWLAAACKSGVQCDMLVISSHFAGGDFFNEDHQIKLTMTALQHQSCDQTCDGILVHPHEVFLMGCNMLATKAPDERSIEQYAAHLGQVTDDGVATERAVAARDEADGEELRNQTTKIFDLVPHVYGFNSTGPLGPQNATVLEDYFRHKGDYNKYYGDEISHLSQDRVHRELVAAAELTNRAMDVLKNIGISPNSQLSAAYTRYYTKLHDRSHFVECSGKFYDVPKKDMRKNICTIEDDRKKLSERLRVANSVIEKSQDLEEARTYLPYIADMLKANPVRSDDGALVFHKGDTWSDTEDGLATFEDLKSNEALKAVLFQSIQNTHFSGIRLNREYMGVQLGWVSRDDYQKDFAKTVSAWLKQPYNKLSADWICDTATSKALDGFTFKLTDVDKSYFGDSFGIKALGCLGTDDPEIHKKLVSLLKYSGPKDDSINDSLLKDSAEDALAKARFTSYEPEIAQAVRDQIDVNLRSGKTDADALDQLAGAAGHLRDPQAIPELLTIMKRSGLKDQGTLQNYRNAILALGEIKTHSPEVENALENALKTDDFSTLDLALTAVATIGFSDEGMKQAVCRVAAGSDPNLASRASKMAVKTFGRGSCSIK